MPDDRSNRPTVIPCASCPARERSVWRALTRRGQAQLDEVKQSACHGAGQVIFHQGSQADAVYCIEKGTVAVRKYARDGRSMIVRLPRRGDLVGHRSQFSGPAYEASAEALTDARMCRIGARDLKQLLRESPDLPGAFLEILARDLGRSEAFSVENFHTPARDRLLRLVTSLRGSHEEAPTGTPEEIRLPMSRQDLAEMIGVRPETLARTIRRLEGEGLAHFERRKVTLLPREAPAEGSEA